MEQIDVYRHHAGNLGRNEERGRRAAIDMHLIIERACLFDANNDRWKNAWNAGPAQAAASAATTMHMT